MDDLFIVPAEWLSILPLVNTLLVVFSVRKIQKMTRNSLVKMFVLGCILLGVTNAGFGIMYGFFSDVNMQIEIRQFAVRAILFLERLIIFVWLVILLKWGENL